MQFLMGLNESYAGVCSQVLITEPLPPLSKVFSLAVQDERQNSIGGVSAILDTVTFAGGTSSPGSSSASNIPVAAALAANGRGRQERPFFTFCGVQGHCIDRCHKLHGFPLGFQPNSRMTQQIELLQMGHMVQLGSRNFNVKPHSLLWQTPHLYLDLDLVSRLTKFSSLLLISALNYRHKLQHFQTLWMPPVFPLHLIIFTKVQPISDVTVTLPSGLAITVYHVGFIVISPCLILQNVMYVPDFQFNLVSISALILDNQCCVIFDEVACLIQDQLQGQTIGRGSRARKLYYLHAPVVTSSATITDSMFFHNVAAVHSVKATLWHARLGHPSFDKLRVLHSHLGIPDDRNSLIHRLCDVCHNAKQLILSFPSDSNQLTQPFELIHLDIWGPLSVATASGHHYFLSIVDDYTLIT